VKVKFNYHKEFLAEVRLGRPQLNIVRQTLRVRRSNHPVDEMFVVCTCINPAGHLVELVEFVGELMGGPEYPTSSKTQQKARALADQIVAALTEMGLEVRAGVYEETK
jgi:hypothetical protein